MTFSTNETSGAPGLILVTGATGKLGRIVTTKLVEQGAKLRILTRRPEAAAALFPQAGIEIVPGDFRDPASLTAAVAGVQRLFLLSPISVNLVAEQGAVIHAARAAGVRRVVKISGSDWTVGTSFSGDAHAEIEADLAAHIPESVAIRPNAWTQVSLGGTIAALASGGDLPSRHVAPVSYIDIRDIADVAVNQLLAPLVDKGPLVITGAESLTLSDIAQAAGAVLGREVALSTPSGAVHPDAPEFERGVIAQFFKVIGAGGASGTTDTVARILGRPPRRVADYLREELTPQQAGQTALAV